MFQIITALVLLGTVSGATPETSRSNEAAQVLSRSAPAGLRWVYSQRLDVNCDGARDELFTAEDETHFFLGVVLAPISSESRSSILQFDRAGHKQSSFCGPFESLTPESLATASELNEMLGGVPDGYTYSKKCQGLELVAGECDKFHIFWNRLSKSLDWWRL